MAKEVHLGDIGTIFRATIKEDDVALDISGATTKELTFKKGESGALLGPLPATFTTDGTDGLLEYKTILDDLDEEGLWLIQARVILPGGAGGTWKSDVGQFVVHPNLVAS